MEINNHKPCAETHYGWQEVNGLSIKSYGEILDTRRIEILDSLGWLEDYDEKTVAEWLALLQRRDELLKSQIYEDTRSSAKFQLLRIHKHLESLVQLSNVVSSEDWHTSSTSSTSSRHAIDPAFLTASRCYFQQLQEYLEANYGLGYDQILVHRDFGLEAASQTPTQYVPSSASLSPVSAEIETAMTHESVTDLKTEDDGSHNRTEDSVFGNLAAGDATSQLGTQIVERDGLATKNLSAHANEVGGGLAGLYSLIEGQDVNAKDQSDFMNSLSSVGSPDTRYVPPPPYDTPESMGTVPSEYYTPLGQNVDLRSRSSSRMSGASTTYSTASRKQQAKYFPVLSTFPLLKSLPVEDRAEVHSNDKEVD